MTRIVVNNAQEFVAAMMEHSHARCEASEDGRSIIVITDKLSKGLGGVLRHGLRAVFAPTRLHDDQAVAVSRILRFWATATYEPGNPNNFFKGFGTGVLSNKKINDAHAIKDVAISAANRVGAELNLRKLRKWELRVNAYCKGLTHNATVRDLLESDLSANADSASINTFQEAAALAQEYPQIRSILGKRIFTDFTEEDHERLQQIVATHKERVGIARLETQARNSDSTLSEAVEDGEYENVKSLDADDIATQIANNVAKRYGNLATLGVRKSPSSHTVAAVAKEAPVQPAKVPALLRPQRDLLSVAESLTVPIANLPFLDEDNVVATEHEVEEELNEIYFAKMINLKDVTAAMAAMRTHIRTRYEQEVALLQDDYEAAVADQNAPAQIRLANLLVRAQLRERVAAEWVAIREGRPWGAVKNPDPSEGGNLRISKVEERISDLNIGVKGPYFKAIAKIADDVATEVLEEGRTLGVSFKTRKNVVVKNEYTQKSEAIDKEVTKWSPPSFYHLYKKSPFLESPDKVGQLEKKIGHYTVLNWYAEFLKEGAPTNGTLRNVYSKDRHRLVAERNFAQSKLNVETRTQYLQNALANFNEANKEIIELRGELAIQMATGQSDETTDKTRKQIEETIIDANSQKEAYVEATVKLNLAKIEAQAAKEYFEALNQEDTAVFTSLIQKAYLATY